MTSKPNLIDVFYASEDELKEYNQKARELSRKHFGDELIAYYPGRFFPSVSLTGSMEQECYLVGDIQRNQLFHLNHS